MQCCKATADLKTQLVSFKEGYGVLLSAEYLKARNAGANEVLPRFMATSRWLHALGAELLKLSCR